MSKQIFCLSKSLKSSILFAFPALAFMLFAAVIVLPVVPASTHAEGDEPEEGITVIASSDITINLPSKDEGYYKIFKDSIKVSTSSENGYTLSIATDSADHQTLYLNGDTTSESKIDGASGTYEEPKALGDYEWGFAVPGIGHFDDTYSTTNPSEDSKFAILPLENKVIRDYTEAVSDNITDIYYGFRLSGALEPGEYETSITYTAVPADQPLTAKAVLGDNGNLNFLYNRNTYTVGETYEDNIGETTVNNVYAVSIDSPAPAWSNSTGYGYVNFDISFYGFKPTTLESWFEEATLLRHVTNANNLNTSNVTDMYRMFYKAGYISEIFDMDLSGWKTDNVTDMSEMFYYAGRNATVWNIGDLSGWKTDNVTDMSKMFCSAGRNATVWNIGNLSNWKVGNVGSMLAMFSFTGQNATTWSIGDLSGWDVSNVQNMASMFRSAGISATAWDIGNLNYIDEDHKGWDVKNVTNHKFFVDWNQENIDTSKLPWQSD